MTIKVQRNSAIGKLMRDNATGKVMVLSQICGYCTDGSMPNKINLAVSDLVDCICTNCSIGGGYYSFQTFGVAAALNGNNWDVSYHSTCRYQRIILGSWGTYRFYTAAACGGSYFEYVADELSLYIDMKSGKAEVTILIRDVGVGGARGVFFGHKNFEQSNDCSSIEDSINSDYTDCCEGGTATRLCGSTGTVTISIP